MKAIEYNKINPFYENERTKYEEACKKAGFSIYAVSERLFYDFLTYRHLKNKISLIERLDFSDTFKVKVLLNKAFPASKQIELLEAKESFEAKKKELFTFLEETKDPYFFILTPFCKFGGGVRFKHAPYQKDIFSGTINACIAADYASWLLSKALYN